MAGVRLSASWVVPVAGPPVADGAVLVGSDGRIARVGPEAEVPRPDGVLERRYGGATILPGLVNAHTHLELTGLEGQVEEADFSRWIQRLRGLKQRRPPEEFLAATRAGLADCWAAGVTTVADTGDSGSVVQALAQAGGSGIAYVEVFGPHPDQLAASLGDLRARVSVLRRFVSPRVRLGVSPHAPYTVSGPLYRAVAEWARAEGMPLAVHLAESPAETALLAQAAGPFAEAWRRRGIPLPEVPGRSPVAWLAEHGVLGSETLCIHVVQVDEEDLGRLARSGSAVAHCPCSNRRHGHGDAPLAGMLRAGLRVGVGTDSVASVGCLDLLAEARLARRLGALSAEATLELVTLAGARALGLDHELGSLEPGKWGDLAVIRLAPGVAADGVVERVLEARRDDVVATFIGGREVFARGTLG
jgi:cytosine/adenosine deaminase-related metal-dependent hydrolase